MGPSGLRCATGQPAGFPTYRISSLPTYQPVNLPAFRRPKLPPSQIADSPINWLSNFPAFRSVNSPTRLLAYSPTHRLFGLNPSITDTGNHIHASYAKHARRKAEAVQNLGGIRTEGNGMDSMSTFNRCLKKNGLRSILDIPGSDKPLQ